MSRRDHQKEYEEMMERIEEIALPFNLLNNLAIKGEERAKFVINLICREANFKEDSPVKNDAQAMAMSICLHFVDFVDAGVDIGKYLGKLAEYNNSKRDTKPRKPATKRKSFPYPGSSPDGS